MPTLTEINSILQSGKTTADKALELFDELDPVSLDAMLGRWQGSGLHTNHPLDGWLEASNWYGKEFVDPDHVHPLLFKGNKNDLYRVAPLPMVIKLALNIPGLKSEPVQPLLRFMTSLAKTEESQARLRMMEYRQKVSATMIYDHLPINDVYRKVDDNTLLGLMDYKEIPKPFFFILKRDMAS